MRQTLTALICLLLATSTQAQERASAATSPLAISSVIKSSGWVIPGLLESHITGPRRLLPPSYGVRGVPLYVTVLKTADEVRTTLSLYGLKEDGKTLLVTERTAAVDSILQYDIDNRVFLYIVQFVIILHEPNGREGYLRCPIF